MRLARPDSLPVNLRCRSIIFAMILAPVAVLILSRGPVLAQTNTQTNTLRVVVDRVIDGDTFAILGLDRTIRIWGLDAPERGRRGGAEATSALRGLIAGQSLTCRVRDIDRYRRIVGQCALPDGRDIAAQMIATGVAREYCHFSGGFYGTCRGD